MLFFGKYLPLLIRTKTATQQAKQKAYLTCDISTFTTLMIAKTFPKNTSRHNTQSVNLPLFKAAKKWWKIGHNGLL